MSVKEKELDTRSSELAQLEKYFLPKCKTLNLDS